MPSCHSHTPISFRPPEPLRDWLIDYAERENRPVRGLIIEALEEYRARREPEGANGMQMLPTEVAREYLRQAFTYSFMQPYQSAQAPIKFPGIAYSREGVLSDDMKIKGAQRLNDALRDQGCIIRFSDDTDVTTALYRALWEKWGKEQIGNGRFGGRLLDGYGHWFTGRQFDDHGQIYPGDTALDAANHTLERLTALGGTLYSYTVQEDGPQ